MCVSSTDPQLVRRVAKAIHAGNHTGWVVVHKSHVVVRRKGRRERFHRTTLLSVARKMELEGFPAIFNKLRKRRNHRSH
jgi:hypothetical protein